MFVTIHLNALTPLQSKSLPYPICVTQLSKANRKSIISYLKSKKQFREYEIINIVTKSPRNYLIDLILADDSIINDQMLPVELQIIMPDTKYQILGHTIITPQFFTILDKIGQGTYAQVFIVQRKYDRAVYCMKRINKVQCLQKAGYQIILNEQQILRKVRGKQIVRLYYSFQDNHYVYLILQLCPYGDLKQALNRGLHQNQKYEYFIQICLGIVYLHTRGIIYRDIKPQNIVIDVRGRIKICDFGFAKVIGQSQTLNQICGSYEYIAPQVIDRKEYNKSLDLYTLGLLFYEILSEKNPFSGMGLERLDEIRNKTINYDNKIFSPTSKDLIQKLLKKQPQLRPGYNNTEELFNQPFFQQNEQRIFKIIGDQISPPLYYNPLPIIPQRSQIVSFQPKILKESFNYIKPKINTTEKIGPKFNFNF